MVRSFTIFFCFGASDAEAYAPTARKGEKCSPPKQDIRLWPERDLENTISVFKIMEAFNISQLNLSCCFHSASAFFSFKHRPASSPSTLKFTKTTIN